MAYSVIRSAARFLILLAVVNGIVSAVAFFTEAILVGRTEAFGQAPCLILLATLFFAFGILCFPIFSLLMRKGGKVLVGFYLVSKIIILLASIVILVAYALKDGQDLLLFALNILSLYVAFLIISTWFYIKAERKTKQQNEENKQTDEHAV